MEDKNKNNISLFIVSVLFKFFVFIRNSIHTKKAYIYQTHSDLLERTKI